VIKFILIFSSFIFTFLLSAVAQDTAAPKKKDPSGKVKIKPVLIRGPYLQAATANSMVVRWRTDAGVRSRVRYGTASGNLAQAADDSTLVTEHIVKLTGLAANTKYYYAIGNIADTLQGDSNNYFYTLPLAGEVNLYRIGVFGDCGNNSVNQRSVRNEFEKYLGSNYLNAWILLGDNTYPDGTDAEYQVKFFNVYKDNLLKKYPLYPSPGNHDYHDVELSAAYAQKSHEVAYYHNFTMPQEGEAGGVPSHTKSFYSYDIGNIHFISLDSYGLENNYRMSDTLGPQVQWVKKDLEANKNKSWVIAYWHHPPYTMGSHNSDNTGELTKIRENFIQILERYGVDLVLCGHSHDYERTRLIKDHYGKEVTFNTEKHDVSSSSGRYDGGNNSCPYIKQSTTNQGTIYVVSGSAGQLGGKQETFPHDAMQYSNATEGGAAILEVQGNRLDLKWICADGIIRDQFTVMKDVNKSTKINLKKGQSATLTASFIGNYKWNKSNATSRSIEITPAASGTTLYEVKDPFNCLKDVFQVTVSK
jgi:hypothetical protein